jgi:hypothetical protein
LPLATTAGRKECANLLRGDRQVQTSGAKIQKSSQTTNSPAGDQKP